MDGSNITLRALIQRAGASTRLDNASSAPVFETTVADFIAARQKVLEQLTKTRNIGRKSIQELEQTIDKYVEGLMGGSPASSAPPNEPSPPEASPLDSLPREVTGVTLRTLVERVGASARLANAAAREEFFENTDVRTYVTLHGSTLPKLPNLGRTSIAEFGTLVRTYLESAGRVLEAITGGTDGLAEGFGASAETTDRALAAIFATMAAHRFAPSEEIDRLPAKEGVLAAVSALPKNGNFVIRRRYGLEGFRPMTLNEVAEEAAVTRERVRQVEVKALDRLETGAGPLFARILEESKETVWNILSGGRALATAVSIAANRGKLDPMHRLAIDVLYEGEEEWAASQGVQTAHGWRRRASEPALPSDARLGERLRQLAFPRPVDDSAARIGRSVPSLIEALDNEPGVKCVDGFVFTGFVGALARRVAMLYRLATEEDFSQPFDIQTLAERHRRQCPDDAVASRMILKALQEHPHLFLHLFDSLWLTLPLDGEQPLDEVPQSLLPFERLSVMDDGGFDEQSIGRMLVNHLRKNGPQRLADLQEVARAKGHVSGVSVGPILLANPCFQRLLPGTYGLYTHCTEEQINATLSVAQCRHFAFARYGGAPRDYFPLWSANYEYLLCRWARFQAPTDIFRSLMFVASPEDWSLPNELLAEWLEIKERHAAWAIGWARRGLGKRLPSGDAFFSALAHLVMTGSTCWHSVNRCAQQKLDSQEAADILAMMVGAGLAIAPTDWQAMHVRTHAARGVLESLAEERWPKGSLDWRSGGLAEVVRLCARIVDGGNMGWVVGGELNSLARAADEDALPADESRPKPDSAGEHLTELLESDAWSKLFDS